MPTPFNRGRFGKKSPLAPRRERDVCGVPMVRDDDVATVCRECAGRPKRERRVERDEDDDDTDEELEEFRDSYLDYCGRDAE